MKNYLFVCLFLSFSFNLLAESIPLKKALEANLISIEIEVNEDETHYSAPFNLTIKNLSRSSINLVLENGTLLLADEVEFQNFIITEQKLLTIAPFKTVPFAVKAMCIEQYDSAPIMESKYTLGNKANSNLCKLSEFVDEKKHFEPNAQFLMWDLAEGNYILTDNHFFELDEYGEVLIMANNTVGESKIINKKDEPEMPQRELKVSGNFTMNLSSVKKIHIGMFNMQNVIVKELYNNPNTPKGENKVEYAFNSLKFPDEKYQIKLVMNGRVMMSREVVMDI